MNNKQLFGIIIILISFFSCSNKRTEFGIEKNFIISGKITNYDIKTSPKTIKIYRRDFFNIGGETYEEEINNDGTFKVKYPISYAEESYLEYGDLISILCIPGDSLYILIDNKILEDKRRQKYKHLKFSESNTGKTNMLISKFNAELPNENYIYDKAIEAEKNLSTNEFTNYISKRENEYYTFLNKFKKENKTTKLFDNWVKDNLKYKSWNDLMRYRWTHPYYNKMEEDSFTLPKKYFYFLRDYDTNDNNLFSIAHADFLQEFSEYCHANVYYLKDLLKHSNQNQRDSLKKAIAINKIDRYKNASEKLKRNITLNTNGFTKDLFFTEYYISILRKNKLKLFEALYDSNFTSQNCFLNMIDNEHLKLKDYLSNQNTTNENLSTIKSSILTGIIDSIGQKYRDKVIYIDFWAPWCGPCMNEMPYSKKIQEYFQNKDVIFLFLASKCKEDSWKATIANKKLTGEHMLLTDDQFNVLSGLLGITGIPHYSMIDKKGNIVLKDAARPSEKDQVISEINRQLNK